MTAHGEEPRIADLVARLQAVEPVVWDLGTPDIGEPPELSDLVGLGPAAVPALLSLVEREPPRVVAYLVKALGQIGDPSAAEPLARLVERYDAMDGKGPWEHAVIGQGRLAIAALRDKP
jgi:HEAT repeat protein